MIQCEEEEENMGHSHERALPTGYHHAGVDAAFSQPDHAAVTVPQGNSQNSKTLESRTSSRFIEGLLSSLTT